MSCDYLTFSPCLLSILSHIDVKDILNCKLVCRRIFHVINRNPYHMPRPEISLTIILQYKQDSSLRFARLLCYEDKTDQEDSFNIEEKETQITFWGHPVPIREYYKKKGLEVTPHRVPTVFAVATGSVADGLDLLCQYICQRHHFSLIQIREATPGSPTYATVFYRILSLQMRLHRTKCEQIQLNISARPDTYSYFNKIDCQYILMVAKTSLGPVLENIPSCDRRTGILVSPETFKCFSAVFDFLKKWQLGKCGRVKNVRVYQEEGGGAFQWTNSDVIGYLKDTGCICVKEERNDDWMEMYLQSEIDKRVIGVRYSQMQGTLIMEEVQEYTGLDEQLRIEFKDTVYGYVPDREPVWLNQ